MSISLSTANQQDSVALTQVHHNHLISEGFTEADITWMQSSLGIRSLTETEAVSLGFKVWDKENKIFLSSSGLLFPFTETFGQLRTDTPPDRDGKPAKYLTQSGKESEPYLPDGYKVLTEGMKDALAGSIKGKIPTGALAGVSHYKCLAKGSGLGLVFDFDGWGNSQVFSNLINAGAWLNGKVNLLPKIEGEPKAGLCEYFKAGYTSEDYHQLIESAYKPAELLIEWPNHWESLDKGKMLKCLQAAIRLAVEHLKPIQQKALINAICDNQKALTKKDVKDLLEEEASKKKQKARLSKDAEKTPAPKLGKASHEARRLQEEYRERLAFNSVSEEWLYYGHTKEGLWDSIPNAEFESLIQADLDARDSEGKGYTMGYVNSIIGLLRGRLCRSRWDEQPGLLPFTNGVLDLATYKLLPHQPGYGFTWQLPRNHVAPTLGGSFPKINAWLDEATNGKAQLKEILLCWLNAVLKGRSDLQRFIHLVGPGGTGKGTFIRLAIQLIGEINTHSSGLDVLCTDKFEVSNLVSKRLAVFSDEDKYSGRLGVFKQLTGGDLLRAEKKHKTAYSFKFNGVAMVASNYPIFAGDTSSGMARRCLTVPFTKQVAPEKRRDLTAEFEPELEALTAYLLSMDDDHVRKTLLGITGESQEVIELSWEMRMRTESIADWLNQRVIKKPAVDGWTERVGSRIDDEFSLYGSYHKFCQQTGSKPVALKEFSPRLLDLCQSIAHWPDVQKRKTRTGMVIEGLKLRSENDHEDGPIDQLIEQAGVKGEGSCEGSCEGSAPLLSGEGAGCEGSEKLLAKKTENESFPTNLLPYQSQKNDFPEKSTVHPSHPSHPLQNNGSDPAHLPAQQPTPDPSYNSSESQNNSVLSQLDSSQFIEMHNLLGRLEVCRSWPDVLRESKKFAPEIKQAAWEYLAAHNKTEQLRLNELNPGQGGN